MHQRFGRLSGHCIRPRLWLFKISIAAPSITFYVSICLICLVSIVKIRQLMRRRQIIFHERRETMRQDLIEAGYRSVEQVMHHGEFALRGAIIDLYTMGSNVHYRIDLLDDKIDSIRLFDAETQCSLQQLEQVNLLLAKRAGNVFAKHGRLHSMRTLVMA